MWSVCLYHSAHGEVRGQLCGVLSLHLYLNSMDQTQDTRLVWPVLCPLSTATSRVLSWFCCCFFLVGGRVSCRQAILELTP